MTTVRVGPRMVSPTLPAVRPVTESVSELLAGVTTREQLAAGDGKSGASLERVTIGDEIYVLKRLGFATDWVARATGDLACRPRLMWCAGLFDRLPDCLDHAVVGCADDPPHGAALLMRDVTEWLVPEGDGPLPLAQHRRFLDHMAALHAEFIGYEDTVGLLPMESRLLVLSPWTAAAERDYGGTHPVPTTLMPQGWQRLPVVAPRAGALALTLIDEPGPLVSALADTPATLVHGDWKCGNLGTGPDGRTILLDWATPGQAPPCFDLAWYVAINAARLPESKEDTIAAYRRALEGHGVDTGGWFERQLELCLIGAFLVLGWEKAFGDPAELQWWEQRVVAAERWLG